MKSLGQLSIDDKKIKGQELNLLKQTPRLRVPFHASEAIFKISGNKQEISK